MSKNQLSEDSGIIQSPSINNRNNASESNIMDNKNFADAVNSWASIAYKVAAAVGAMVTFAYLFSIHHFPTGLTPGEVIFFVFVALAFGFTTTVFILYGAFCSVWILQLIIHALWTFRFRIKQAPSGEVIKKLRNKAYKRANHDGFFSSNLTSIIKKIRSFRRNCTRHYIKKDLQLQPPTNGLFFGFLSLLVFLLMARLYVIAPKDIRNLLLGFLAGGAALVLITSDSPGGRNLKTSGWKKWLIWIGFPLGITVLMGNPMPLFRMVFEQLGIRSNNVSLEVPESERLTMERISEAIGHPIIDCHKAASGRFIVHSANVLWTSIGTETIIEFTGSAGDSLSKPESRQAIQSTTNLETKDIRILKTKPVTNLCFDLPSDLSFESGKYDLTPTAVRQIYGLAETINEFGSPKSIKVRGHSDPRPFSSTNLNNQTLSELRAKAVADALKSKLEVKDLEIAFEGVGAMESKVSCPSNVGVSKLEIEQCHKANRRVEIQIDLHPTIHPTT